MESQKDFENRHVKPVLMKLREVRTLYEKLSQGEILRVQGALSAIGMGTHKDSVSKIFFDFRSYHSGCELGRGLLTLED